MDIRLLEFAEYCSITDDGRLVVGGIFTGFKGQLVPVSPGQTLPPAFLSGKPILPMPPVWLVWIVEISLAEGLSHAAGLRVRNGSGVLILDMPDIGSATLSLNKAGQPMRMQGRVAIGGTPLPGPDDYVFELLIDGHPVGTVTLYVDLA